VTNKCTRLVDEADAAPLLDLLKHWLVNPMITTHLGYQSWNSELPLCE